MIERKRYVMQNFDVLLKVVLLAIGFWISILAFLYTKDPGIKVLGVAVGFVLFFAVCAQLNILVKYNDDKFMANGIFWIGSISFSLVGVVLRSSIGGAVLLFSEVVISIASLSLVIFYLTGTDKVSVTQTSKISD